MAELVSDEEMAVCTDAVPSSEKIAERKTIVYETRIDPTVAKMAGEKIKVRLFTRFGFLKPKSNEIQFVSVDKYYEPYLVIGGRYSIDYYRNCAYTVKVAKDVLEVIILGRKFDSIQHMDLSAADHNTIRLEGEERLKNDARASLVLDRSGRDMTLERFPSAPSERNPKKTLATFRVEEIAPDADLSMIRSRLAVRPKDVSRIVSEIFEVDERAIIYTPRFKVTFRNTRTGEGRTVEFDGVTAEKLRETKIRTSQDLPPPPPP
jgi:hypothetical protein